MGLIEGGAGGDGGESLISEESQANLTIDLRVAATGGKTAQLPAEGQSVAIDVYATVTGDFATAWQAFQSVQGSFVSTNVSAGSAFGTLDAQNVAAFDYSGASYGSHHDLDGDGDLDLGGTNADYADGYWIARAGGLEWSNGPAPSYTWKLATLSFTVTDLIAGTGTTEINFVKRSDAETSALWVVDEDVQNMRDGTSPDFTVGAPVVLTH